MTLKDILKYMLEANASDLHLKVGSPPVVRVNGGLQPVGKQVISNDHLKTFASQVLSERQRHIDVEAHKFFPRVEKCIRQAVVDVANAQRSPIARTI